MSSNSVVQFVKGRHRHEPSFSELAERAQHLQEGSPSGSLRSARAVLMAMFVSANEALDQLPDEPFHPPARGSSLESSLGAVGAYLVHACKLADLPLGELISDRFDRDEADLVVPAQRSAR